MSVPASARPRWRQPLLGAVAGALAAALAFVALGALRTDPVEEIISGYYLSDEDALTSGPVQSLHVWDVRQPSSIPGLAAPTGDHYVTLVMELQDRENGQEWTDLTGLTLTAHAVDVSGEREELTLTDRGRRTLDGIGGAVRGSDPYWIRVSYESPSLSADHYEVVLDIDGAEHAMIAGNEESS